MSHFFFVSRAHISLIPRGGRYNSGNGKVLVLSEKDERDVSERVLIIQMLLVHEKRLKQIDTELRSIREYLTDIDALREQLSDWLKLSEKLKRIEAWTSRDLSDNR